MRYFDTGVLLKRKEGAAGVFGGNRFARYPLDVLGPSHRTARRRLRSASKQARRGPGVQG